jgi:Fe(3+) dicitrate transport protein
VHYDLLRNISPAQGATLNLYANALLLEARFKHGPVAGRTPQYAPQHVIRSGLIYTQSDRIKLGLTGTFSADSFADDANSASRHVPAYAVWDLTVEVKIPRTPLRVIGGINNVFDEDYYSRIRPDGIDPAPRRNAYLGVAAEF